MHWKRSAIVLAVAVAAASLSVRAAEERPWVPENGFVPNTQTAIRIAEAVWIPIYGEKQIASERPFKAVLRGDTWVVTGTLPSGASGGGTALAEIAKRDGRILRVVHFQ
jgi:hypothetical protein